MHLRKFYIKHYHFKFLTIYLIVYVFIRFPIVFVFDLIIKEVHEDIEHDIKFSWVQSDKKKVAEREATPVVRIVCVV